MQNLVGNLGIFLVCLVGGVGWLDGWVDGVVHFEPFFEGFQGVGGTCF